MISNTLTLFALRNRLLAVAGIPDANNLALVNRAFTPTVGTAYLEEDYVPAPPAQLSVNPNGGTMEARGFYVVRWYGPEDKGVTSIYAGADAILAAFAAGTRLTLTNGDTVRIAGKPVGPVAGPIRNTKDGWAVCTISIPFWLLTSNAIAA